MGLHPSHKTRISMDASSYDEICVLCGATDQVLGGWGDLAKPCPATVPQITDDGNWIVSAMPDGEIQRWLDRQLAALSPEERADYERRLAERREEVTGG